MYKVFISGPMSGYDNFNREMFNKCEAVLTAQGYAVFNPAWCQYNTKEWTDNEIMRINLLALSCCDYICHLPGWSLSRGANVENKYAVYLQLKHLTFDGEEIKKRFKEGDYL